MVLRMPADTGDEVERTMCESASSILQASGPVLSRELWPDALDSKDDVEQSRTS
jgi:hypothetical protein